MKILLRNYGNQQYVWKTAKYNYGSFIVNGEPINQTEIVSIVNDNRKNYIQCSSCGQVFKRDDVKFHIHKQNASSPSTCFGCKYAQVDDAYEEKRHLEFNKYGEIVEKFERKVRIVCGKDSSSWWSTPYDITSTDSICNCNKRQCVDATEMEIYDFFTEYPGAFDDIATIDGLFDYGYNEVFVPNCGHSFDIEFDDNWTIGVYINQHGIIDRFYVWFECDRFWLHYSKKYDELFFVGNNHQYKAWHLPNMSDQDRSKIKEHIAKFYR